MVIVYIIIMLLILCVLISLHELGHLSMAKLFKVYCFEYSIGFGPKLLHVKRKNGETYFSIRAIPLGGYVSMYGEEGVLPEDFQGEVDSSRSLENVAKWKAAIIMVAGVVVNYILGLILIFVAVSCFPIYYVGYGSSYAITEQISTTMVYNDFNLEEGSAAYASFLSATGKEDAKTEDYYLLYGATYTYDKAYSGISGSAYVLDGNVEVFRDGSSIGTFVALFSASELTASVDFIHNVTLYPALKAENGSLLPAESEYQSVGIEYIANTSEAFSLNSAYSYSFTLDFYLLDKSGVSGNAGSSFSSIYDNKISYPVSYSSSGSSYVSNGLKSQPLGEYNSWEEAWGDWSCYVPWANSAIIQGFASIFTGGLSNMSGIIGMTASVGTVMSYGGASMVFLYAGLISINLAFFNLLPFPGLDGWQLLVLFVEGVFRKKIPVSVKSIVSYVGLALLFGLAIVVAVMDIIRLV